MENENLTPTPEQPPEQPPVQPQYQPPVQSQYQPPVQSQYPPQYPQYPQYAQPRYQPPKKKIAAWKIVVPIVAGVLALAIFAGVCFLFLRATPVMSVELSETRLSLEPKESRALSFTFSPADADEFEYRWSSSDPSVAKVDDGTVTAVGTGSCTITLYVNDDVNAVCHVVVGTPDAATIYGTWTFAGAYVNDEYYDVGASDATLIVYADHTGKLVIDGKTTSLYWNYDESLSGMDYYWVYMEDGTYCELWYNADPADEYYGELTFYGDDWNMIFFTR